MPGCLFKTVPLQYKGMGIYWRLHCRATFKNSCIGIVMICHRYDLLLMGDQDDWVSHVLPFIWTTKGK